MFYLVSPAQIFLLPFQNTRRKKDYGNQHYLTRINLPRPRKRGAE